MKRIRVPCPICQKLVSLTNIKKHQKSKKCKNFKNKNNKTGAGDLFTPTSSRGPLPEIASESKIITEINMKQEFDKMSTTVNPKKSKEDEFECGACGKKFNEKYACCPHCGCEFEE